MQLLAKEPIGESRSVGLNPTYPAKNNIIVDFFRQINYNIIFGGKNNMNYRDIAKELVDTYQLNIKVKALTGINIDDVINALLETASIKEAADILDIPEDKLESYIRRHLKPSLPTKTTKHKWSAHLLICVNRGYCTVCNTVQPIDSFSMANNRVLGKSRICKQCDTAKTKKYRASNLDSCREYGRNHYYSNKEYYLNKNAKYRAKLGMACPSWANEEKIRLVYTNVPEGMHVDHIYPLNSDWVCGLHVYENLQYLSPEDNWRKSNLYNPLIH